MPTGQATPILPTLRRLVRLRQSATLSDGELLGAFVNGRDAEAFAELVRRHGPMVLGVCSRVVGDRTTAEDAFQAAFLVLARRAASVRPREQVGNWLYGVAYRTALKARTVLVRRRSREKQVAVMPEPTAPTASPSAWTDLQPVIDEELARLPDKLRLPVVLCDLEGRPQREVAKHLNVPPATLATRLASARRTLAQRLTRRGVTLSGGALAGLLGVHAAASAVPKALAAGVVRAVEAVAAGSSLHSLVSAQSVQLSEGVMRMMMLAKLKAVAVMAVTVLALTTGLGLGLVPAMAADEPVPGAPMRAKAAGTPPSSSDKRAARKDHPAAEPAADDATFLRRLCLDVCGTLPTKMEMWYFISDADDNKRAKVVDWITDDDAAKLALAKKLGVPPERIHLIRGRLSADGKFVELRLEKAAPTLNLNVIGPGALYLADTEQLLVLPNSLTRTDKEHRLGTWVDVNADGKARTDKGYRLGTWVDVNDDGKDATTAKTRLRGLRTGVLDAKTGKLLAYAPPQRVELLDFDADGWADQIVLNERNFDVINEVFIEIGTDDAEFLKRVLTDVRGNGPTTLELKYFTEDKDPKKREKLIDTLLRDAAVQKKLGDAWKAKMLAPQAATIRKPARDPLLFYVELDNKLKPMNVQPNVTPPPSAPKPPQPPVPPTLAVPQADKFEKLIGVLIAAKKSDEAILEAVTLATLSRLPTDSKKKLALTSIATAADRKAAWVAVARALAGAEAKPMPPAGR